MEQKGLQKVQLPTGSGTLQSQKDYRILLFPIGFWMPSK